MSIECTQSDETVRLPALTTYLAPLPHPPSATDVPAGATFFVRTRGWACSEPGEPRKGTKVLLKFTEGKHRGQTSHIDVTKLVPVLHSSRPSPAGRALVLCQETVPFRHVARCQISSSDVVVELGCSFGEMTSVLLERTAHVIGVDHASSVLEAAARRAPAARYELLDALAHPARLLALCRTCAPTAVFIDLGGDRPAADLVPLLAQLHAELTPTVSLVVVKCRALAQAAQAHASRRADGARGGEPAMPSTEVHPCAAPLPDASGFWAAQLRRAALLSARGGAGSGGGGSAAVVAGAGVLDEQNRNCSAGETRLCFEFTNKGRCRRRDKCSFRHVLREHPDAIADAEARGRAGPWDPRAVPALVAGTGAVSVESSENALHL